MRWKIVAIVLALTSSAFAQSAKHPFTFENMMRNLRCADVRWCGKENFKQSRRRHHAALFAGWKYLAWRSQALVSPV
jgi:hypothetical protein